MNTWPPKPFDTALAQISVHDAWYVGDPDALHKAYSHQTGGRTRSSQHSGGIVGAVARFFWGRPMAASKQRTRLHVPIAADIATTSADLLFATPPRVLLPKQDAEGKADHPAQERLEAIVNTADLHSTFLEAAELAAAHGGAYLRIVWDIDALDTPFLTVVAADGAIPTWRFGRLREVTFWTIIHTNGQLVVRHLETHLRGSIRHQVFEGTTTDLGRPVPLGNYEQTAWAAELVNDQALIETGTDRLTAAYIPNMLPQRRWRKITELAPLGRSDFDGVEGVFDAIDEVYSSWMRDIRLAKARLLVDQNLMETDGPGTGATFDDDQELFTAIPGGAGSMQGGAGIDAKQFAIRWEEHQRTIQDLTRVALRAAGYSPGSFGDESVSVQETATQVKSKERLTERTRAKKIRYWKAALGPLVQAMLEVDGVVFAPNGYDGATPEVRFPEKAQQDVLELAETVEVLHRAEAVSLIMKIRMLHPDWDAVKVDEEVGRIQDENSVADPFSERGLEIG